MDLSMQRRVFGVGLLLAAFSFAPAPPVPPSQLSTLAKARLEAARKQYQETWSYYQQARIDTYQVYVWSKIILDCEREMTEKPAEHIAAIENHLGRMKKLEALVKKVRRIGFGRSYDVGASEYYRLEAEHRLALARPRNDGGRADDSLALSRGTYASPAADAESDFGIKG